MIGVCMYLSILDWTLSNFFPLYIVSRSVILTIGNISAVSLAIRPCSAVFFIDLVCSCYILLLFLIRAFRYWLYDGVLEFDVSS